MYDIIEANRGEMVFDYLLRVKEEAVKRNCPVRTDHNTTIINVYPQSDVSDLAEKFDLRRALDQTRNK